MADIDPVAIGRDTKGRFAKGNQFGVGNGGRPPRSTEESYLRAFGQAMPTQKWVDTLKVYAEKAADGDSVAMRFFANYLIGKPLERVIMGVGVMDPRERELLEELSELYRRTSAEEWDDTSSETA